MTHLLILLLFLLYSHVRRSLLFHSVLPAPSTSTSMDTGPRIPAPYVREDAGTSVPRENPRSSFLVHKCQLFSEFQALFSACMSGYSPLTWTRMRCSNECRSRFEAVINANYCGARRAHWNCGNSRGNSSGSAALTSDLAVPAEVTNAGDEASLPNEGERPVLIRAVGFC